MSALLSNIGSLAVLTVICLIYQHIVEYNRLKYFGHTESSEVYQAAKEFAQGAAPDEIKSLLTSCPELDSEDADQILSWSLAHKNDKDGGYHEFLKSVNIILGVSLYQEARLVS